MDNLYDVKIDGVGKLNGGKYKDIKISGVGTILSNIEGQKVNIDGVGEIKGSVKCNELAVEGTLSCSGGVDVGEKVNVNGMLTVNGNLQGREVFCDGYLKVKGLLSADKVVLIAQGKNKIAEIGGEEITIKVIKRGIMDGLFFSNKLVSDSIEGDTISLENTICKIVRGHNIKINKGCTIDRVEYTGELVVDENAKIKESIKL